METCKRNVRTFSSVTKLSFGGKRSIISSERYRSARKQASENKVFQLVVKARRDQRGRQPHPYQGQHPKLQQTVELAVELRKSIQNPRGLKCLADTRKSTAFVIFNVRREYKSGNKADPCSNSECPIENSGAKKH